MNEFDPKFMLAAKRLLDDSVADLDSRTLSRLTQGRNKALEGRGRRAGLWKPLPLAGMAASMAGAVVVLFLVFHPIRQNGADTLVVADIGLLTSEESVEFFEDIEFFEWLVAADGQMGDVSSAAGIVPDRGAIKPGLCSAAATSCGTGDGNARISWRI